MLWTEGRKDILYLVGPISWGPIILTVITGGVSTAAFVNGAGLMVGITLNGTTVLVIII